MEYIYINNNSLCKEICNDIIYLYNLNKDSKCKKGLTAQGLNIDIKDTTDLCINYLLHNKEDNHWINIHKLLYTELYKNLRIYISHISNKQEYKKYFKPYNKFTILSMNPLKAQTFQIQKYEPTVGKYVYHNDFQCDIEKKQYRIITYIWYLNNVEEGGETEFWGDYKIKPETGKLVLFPSTWTYPHCANIPISGEKYIITGWIYADMNS